MSAVEKTANAVAMLYARLIALCGDFKLPTLATELVPRFQQAGHDAVLPLLLEIFELEAQDRLERRIDRLRRASHLPPGKTMATLDQARLCCEAPWLTAARAASLVAIAGRGRATASSAMVEAAVTCRAGPRSRPGACSAPARASAAVWS